MFFNQPKRELEYARQQYKIAEHFLNVTYPLTNDPKLLMGIVYNLCGALDYALEALIRNSEFTLEENWRKKLMILRMNSLINEAQSKFIAQLEEIKSLHRACPTEFIREGKIVMCTKDYHLKTLTIGEIKTLTHQTEEFIIFTEAFINRK